MYLYQEWQRVYFQLKELMITSSSTVHSSTLQLYWNKNVHGYSIWKIKQFQKSRIYDAWLAVGSWFPPGTVMFSTTKTDRHNKTEILLKSGPNIGRKMTNCPKAGPASRKLQKHYRMLVSNFILFLSSNKRIVLKVL